MFFSFSSMTRKSRYFTAFGKWVKVLAAESQSTSQSATMFSLFKSSRSAAPRPPAPMTPRFSLPLGEDCPVPPRTCRGRMVMLETTAPELTRNERREILPCENWLGLFIPLEDRRGVGHLKSLKG